MRYKEALLLLGSPFLGILFTIPYVNIIIILKSFFLLLAAFLFYGHVYTFNEWSGLPLDRLDKEKKDWPLVSGKISPREELTLSICLFSATAIVSLLLLRVIFYLVLLDTVLWIIYAHPKILLKGKPILPSLLHFVAGTIHFLSGYLLFSMSLDLNGVLIGFFFALIFTGGHLNHEIKDFDADKESGIMTGAIRFGKKWMLLASFSIFTLSTVYFCILSLFKILPNYLCIGILVIYPFYCYFFYSTCKAGISYDALYKFRSMYRMLYTLAGVYMVILLIIPN